jgi:myo-inositol-1-phosphate synthase
LNLELKLEVWDSPNSAGVVIDVVRLAKVAKDHGLGGVLNPVCAVYMKSPPTQVCDEEAADDLEHWLTETAS